MTFFNLDFEDLLACQLVNKASNLIVENPMFWLKKWRFNRGLSKNNQEDWIKALQLTKNTNLETNVILYIKKVIKIGHIVDVPCYIEDDVVKKATASSFEEAWEQKDAGVLQILAPLTKKFNTLKFKFAYGYGYGNINIVKVLAPLIENPNAPPPLGRTPIHWAAYYGHLDVIKFVAPLTENPNAPYYTHYVL